MVHMMLLVRLASALLEIQMMIQLLAGQMAIEILRVMRDV